MTDEYEKRLRALQRREIEEAETPRARHQAMLDLAWQQKLDAAAEDQWKLVGGFLERRHSETCHRGRWDDDY
jgi:hypothetical protein